MLGGGGGELHYVDEVTGITLGKGWESYILSTMITEIHFSAINTLIGTTLRTAYVPKLLH